MSCESCSNLPSVVIEVKYLFLWTTCFNSSSGNIVHRLIPVSISDVIRQTRSQTRELEIRRERLFIQVKVVKVQKFYPWFTRKKLSCGDESYNRLRWCLFDKKRQRLKSSIGQVGDGSLHRMKRWHRTFNLRWSVQWTDRVTISILNKQKKRGT